MLGILNVILLIVRLVIACRRWRTTPSAVRREYIIGSAVALAYMVIGIGGAIGLQAKRIQSHAFDAVLITWLIGFPIAALVWTARYEKRKKMREATTVSCIGFPVLNVKSRSSATIPTRRGNAGAICRVLYDDRLEDRAFAMVRYSACARPRPVVVRCLSFQWRLRSRGFRYD